MPLTTRGLQTQILGALGLYQSHKDDCSPNDCKVVLNHLVRKYTEPLARERIPFRRYLSNSVARGECDDTVVDHAVPVIVIIEALMLWAPEKVSINDVNRDALHNFLIDSLVLVEISRKEDALLSANGYQRRMPTEWKCGASPLMRYRVCDIELSESKTY